VEAVEAVAVPSELARWRDAVELALRGGELLTAFDAAEQALLAYPDDRWLQHRAVLALARAGSTREARQRFRQYQLSEVDSEDVKALAARLEKDAALQAHGKTRRAAAAHAASLYQAVFESTGGYYSGVNAATLYLLAGDPRRARTLAEQVVRLAREAGSDGYYAAATEAEAQLLLGRLPAAAAALARARELADGDFGALATTRRQLRLVCRERSISSNVLDALAVPEVVHFCGHRLVRPDDPRFTPTRLAETGMEIDTVVAARRIGFGYGSLASGADILWAEALLRHGAEVHVVLPFDADEFVERSVAPAGTEWVERFRTCVGRAATVRYATEDSYLGDDVLYNFASQIAMGLALLRAGHIDAQVTQLALWDGGSSTDVAGTAADVEIWRRTGRRTQTLGLSVLGPDRSMATRGREPSGRVIRAIVFADIKGFSKLREAQLPSFCRHVLGAFAHVLHTHERSILYRERPGDGLYLVLADAEAAAEVAIDLQRAVGAIDKRAAGLPDYLALRVGAHVGPVLPFIDPVLGMPSFTGSHVSRTARIEPVTPPGSIFVTEQFAASLLVLAPKRYRCDYVGHMPAAKDYGRLRMYRLRRAKDDDA
jgi:hypothetical protein